jgi:hypothetical protein
MKIQFILNSENNINMTKIKNQRKDLSNLNYFTGCLYFKLLLVLFFFGYSYLKFKHFLIIEKKFKLMAILKIKKQAF